MSLGRGAGGGWGGEIVAGQWEMVLWFMNELGHRNNCCAMLYILWPVLRRVSCYPSSDIETQFKYSVASLGTKSLFIRH